MAAPNPSPARVPRESFATAVDALLKWIRSQPKHQKSQLFEADDVIYLILSLARIPSRGRTNPYRIPIPHPLHRFDAESTSICLILDDRPSSPLPPAAALDRIRAHALPIASVLGLSDLSSDYRPYESRRKLCDSYDLFFADRKILPLLPRLLGKHFFRRKKIPLAVDSARPGWPEQIKAWCESSLLYLRTGTCAGLKIGRVTQSRDQIADNAVAVIERAMELVPKKWGNLRSLHVKTVESVALPVYQAVPEIGLKIEGALDGKDGSFLKGKKRVRDEEEEEEVKGKKGKKGKRERIHDVHLLDGQVLNEKVEGVNDESEMENTKGGDDDVVGNEEDAESSEMKVEGKKKEMGKKGGKATKVKRGQDEGDGREQKKTKKQKKMVIEANLAFDSTRKSKSNNKEKIEDDVVLNDEEAVNGLGMEKTKPMKGGKAKKGKRFGAEDDAGEENEARNWRMTKDKKLEKDAIVVPVGTKKTKAMKPKVAKK